MERREWVSRLEFCLKLITNAFTSRTSSCSFSTISSILGSSVMSVLPRPGVSTTVTRLVVLLSPSQGPLSAQVCRVTLESS